MNKDEILGWNHCVHMLYVAGIITVDDLVTIWQMTHTAEQQDAYYNK